MNVSRIIHIQFLKYNYFTLKPVNYSINRTNYIIIVRIFMNVNKYLNGTVSLKGHDKVTLQKYFTYNQ